MGPQSPIKPLDLPISFFEYDHQWNSFKVVPSRITTLRRIVTTQYYREQVGGIRVEPDERKQKELKKQLPAITPVALLRHRRGNTTFADKIVQQHPLLYVDFDRDDNPGVEMSELKKHVCRLPYVLLCADSVRHGFWSVIRLPEGQNHESLAAHFRYIQWLFQERFGVKIDPSKGGNPTHLRFVSYDPAPYLNEEATVMPKTYTPVPPKPKFLPAAYSPTRQSERDLLTPLVRNVEAAVPGTRHDTLLKNARAIGGYIASGLIEQDAAVYALETVVSEWPDFSKSCGTIRYGIRSGMDFPIYPEERQPVHNKPVPPPRPVIYTDYHRQDDAVSQSVVRDEPFVSISFEEQPVSEAVEQPAVAMPPSTKVHSFYEWQQSHRLFSQLGLNSLRKA